MPKKKETKLKKTSFILTLVIGIIAIYSVSVYAEAANTLISLKVDYWMPSVDAEVKSSELSLVGTQIDLVDDLGLDDSESIPAVMGSIDFPLFPEILVSYFAVDSSASKVITKDIVYKGTTYSISDTVSSSYDITHFEALLNFGLIKTEMADLGLLIGAKYFEVETTLTSTSAGVTQTESIKGPVPVIGVKGGVGLPGKFRVEGIGRGLVLEVGDVNASIFDVDLGMHYDFNKFLRASAGYRYFAIDAEDTSDNVTDKAEIKFAGPYIGITGSF